MEINTQKQYLAMPQSGRGAGVLVFHAWWGLNDFFRRYCDALSKAGYVALAPDLYGGKVANTIAEAEKLRDEMNDEAAAAQILSAIQDLRGLPATTGRGLAVIGFSLGAAWALWLAQSHPEGLRGVTTHYGTRPGNYTETQAAFLGHFAEKDPYETPEEIEALETSLKAANRPVHFYTYPGTGHWFCEDDRPEAYHAEAAHLAWERTLAFLKEKLD